MVSRKGVTKCPEEVPISTNESFGNRGHVFTVEQFEQVMAFENDEAMQKKWKAFCRKIDTKIDSYSTVLRTIRSFLRKPIVAAIDKKPFNEH